MSRSTASDRHPDRRPEDLISHLDLRPPRWVEDALGTHPAHIDVGPHIRGVAAGPLAVLSTTIALATTMPAGTLRAEVALAYRRFEDTLGTIARTAIRFWNYIPSIGEPMGQGLDRYMAFNAGRYEAFAHRCEAGTAPLDWPAATASAVGVGGTDLVVHCLAAESAGIPVENPRQTSSWRYSARYGPMPPCFSRATIATIAGRRRLLIGGTASIVGEHSQHRGDAEAQLQETLRNIGALIGAARDSDAEGSHALRRLVDLRVYAQDDHVARVIRRQLDVQCPGIPRVEIVRARVCRPELLLEMEGVAEI